MPSFIFDFNGTLIRDSHVMEQSWRKFIQDLIGREVTSEEFDQIHGRTNHLVFEYFLGKKLTEAEGEKLTQQKEAVYRDLLLKSQQAKLIDGVADYLDFLKENKQPINIATVSPKVNVDFFFDLFHLEQWFDYDKVVYNDGTLKSKPEPDFYVQAALNLNASPDQMIVFEDSSLGLQGAHNAQAEHIIAMATDDNHEKLLQTGLIDFVIDDFTDPRIKNIIDFYDE